MGASPSVPGVTPETVKRVAWRLMPFLLLCYFISFLDRGNVAFAALQMNKDIGLSPSQYGFGSGLFFLTYCIFEVPSNLALFQFGATSWIARIMFTWGMSPRGWLSSRGPTASTRCACCWASPRRAFFPGCLFFLTLWFPATYRGRILGVFMAGVAISGAIGSPISGYLLSLDGSLGLRGWQWLFIVEGAPAILLAPICLLYLQDGPAKANWLPDAERAALAATLAAEKRERDSRGVYSFSLSALRICACFLSRSRISPTFAC